VRLYSIALLERAIAKVRRLVYMSVRLSVTLVSHSYAVQGIEIRFTPRDRAIFLVS